MMHYAEQYRDALLLDVIPFWEKYSPDARHGGYFTCLDKTGQVFDTDKFVWLQARQIWTFSMLYNRLAPHSRWLDCAKSGADFLRRYGMDKEGHFFFSLTMEGSPLVQPYNIFSDCFAAMAFGQFGLAAKDESYLSLATKTFEQILRRQSNPKGPYAKNYPGTRPLSNFSLPMILSNLCLELEPLLPAALVEETLDNCIHQVMEVFLDPEKCIIYENRLPDGSFSNSFEGRLINPGHGIEAMWFMMDIAHRRNDHDLMTKAIQVVLSLLEYGWDKAYGGIFYFLDAQGKPPQQLEWDQKLWWVHLEALVALAKAWKYQPSPEIAQWFEKVHLYTWKHFPDPEGGEWYGYLNRRGEVLLPLKGGKWKGCFHVPRALFQVWKTLETP
ncbi:MAG: AGE family epimerase/isomerase [Saprospiraceae bacterium]|nr:AGE family epimerase/isomerase [Saprospiraceae bacterium]MDP4819485.1 AGE family epimerase/isomerase [Saprospiraceae bacterium]